MAKMTWKPKAEIEKEKKIREQESLRQVEVRKQEETMKKFLQHELSRLIDADELTDEQKESFSNLYEPFEVGKFYDYDERVRYEGIVYRVRQPHVTQLDWIPPNVPALFEVILQKQTEDGEEVVHEWEQPVTGPNAVPPYKTGDKVRFDGKIYVSQIDNNSWSPEAYPAGWSEVTE